MAEVNIPIVFALPTSGSWSIGDLVHYGAFQEIGSDGSKHTIWGWKRATNGTNNVLNVDWFELRAPDGN